MYLYTLMLGVHFCACLQMDVGVRLCASVQMDVGVRSCDLCTRMDVGRAQVVVTSQVVLPLYTHWMDDVVRAQVVEATLGLRLSGRKFNRTPIVAGSRNTLVLDGSGQVNSAIISRGLLACPTPLHCHCHCRDMLDERLYRS